MHLRGTKALAYNCKITQKIRYVCLIGLGPEKFYACFYTLALEMLPFDVNSCFNEKNIHFCFFPKFLMNKILRPFNKLRKFLGPKSNNHFYKKSYQPNPD